MLNIGGLLGRIKQYRYLIRRLNVVGARLSIRDMTNTNAKRIEVRMLNQRFKACLKAVCVALVVGSLLIAPRASNAAQEPSPGVVEMSKDELEAHYKPQIMRAIVGEAGGEGYEGMYAVAHAIRNRGTLKGVYGADSPMVDKQPRWVFEQAALAWEESEDGDDPTKGATHWESVDFKKPLWAYKMTETLRLNKHVFYKEQR